MKNKRLIFIISLVAMLLLIPFISMQFSDEVQWTFFDFLIAAVILLASGLVIDWIIRKVKVSGYRIILILALLTMLVLIWAELAVGIFGTPFGGN